ncbi:MAG: hypothetical protein FJ040_02485 [Chloroflexi bacterium]|jgi:hypothetical protein|nr:hypothetical protein [Chloroflexota bacterium]
MTTESPEHNQPNDDAAIAQRVRRGCNFIVGLFAVLTAVNTMAAGGFNNLAVQIFAGLFVISLIVRIVIAREGK